MLRNLPIGARLFALLAVMVALVAIVLSLGMVGMWRINLGLRDVYEERTVALMQLNALERDMVRLRLRFLASLDAKGSAERGRLNRQISDLEQTIDEQLARYMAGDMSADETTLAAEVSARLTEYRGIMRHGLDLIAAGDLEEAHALNKAEAGPRFLALDEAVVNAVNFQEEGARQQYLKGKDIFHTATLLNLVAVAVGLAVAVGFAIAVMRSITGGITGLVRVMDRLVAGDTAIEVGGRDRRDELGEMARALEVFKVNAIERTRLEAEEKSNLARREARTRALERLMGEFDKAVSGVMGSLSVAARSMTSLSEGLASVAEETQRQGSAVSAATGEASASVGAIAGASTQLHGAISEIAEQVSRSASISAQGVTEVGEANRRMEQLAEGARRIGDVVALINAIARQTNMLALNATIEAARAGEAGKGFAVVAHEVKDLANQTAKATGEIEGQVAAIQADVRDAVSSIGRVTGVIQEISEMAATIAAAIDQQGVAVAEVARNADQAAGNTEGVATRIAQVVDAAGQTGAMAGQVHLAAGQLQDESDRLRGSVTDFLEGVRAA
ncbi:MAG TPA: methyl-accepting chemotaxis protein [Magnetospirillum sp.]|jgi:methyl-accepting chemotaxis protein|nr:methyl-accepting chemotaxis protein [Magnetospirillum sp.]